MKLLEYSVSENEIHLHYNNGYRKKHIILWRSTNVLYPDCNVEWDGTVVDAIRLSAYKLGIGSEECFIETIRPTPDVLWKEKHILWSNKMLCFVYEQQNEQDWKLFDNVFESLGWCVVRKGGYRHELDSN